MGKFRKRPVVIDAEQCKLEQVIHTLEGDMIAEPGDWIITGVKGERYPCKPDIFEATYDALNRRQASPSGRRRSSGTSTKAKREVQKRPLPMLKQKTAL